MSSAIGTHTHTHTQTCTGRSSRNFFNGFLSYLLNCQVKSGRKRKGNEKEKEEDLCDLKNGNSFQHFADNKHTKYKNPISPQNNIKHKI